MTKKQFDEQCYHLERLGCTLIEIEPYNKYAKYIKNGQYHTVGYKKQSENQKENT